MFLPTQENVRAGPGLPGECGYMKEVVLLSLWVVAASAATHSLRYCYTAISGVTDFPEFTVVGALDGHHFEYFDSIGLVLVPRSAWMERNANEYHWELFTEPLTNQYHSFKALLAYLQQQFNQSQPGAVQTLQNLYGCDWDTASGREEAYHHHGYGGKDLIRLDMKTKPMKWEAATSEAEPLARKWNNLTRELAYLQWYFTKECPGLLRKYVSYASDTLESIVPPSVSLLQASPSSPVTCLATGFYPGEAVIYWTKAGMEHHEDVEYRDMLSNPDGTFQLRSLLSVRYEEWDKGNFSCVVQHQGREVTILLDPSKVITNWTRHPTLAPGFSPGLVGAVVGVGLTVLSVLAGLVFWSRGRRRHKPALILLSPAPPSTTHSDEEEEEEEEIHLTEVTPRPVRARERRALVIH